MVSMCTVTGTLKILGITEAATITVKADAPFYDDTTTPDSVFLPIAKTFTIPSTGVVSLSLPVSEPYGVAYKFRIVPASGGSVEFSAAVPDAPTVELASLMGTPFTTDRAATGALRIAREMLLNVNTRPYIIEGLGINRRSTPPPAPIAADGIWINTATGEIWTWNPGLTKWQSPVYSVPIFVRGQNSSVTLNNVRDVHAPTGSTIRLLSVYVRGRVLGANDANNRFDLQPGYYLFSSASVNLIGSVIALGATATIEQTVASSVSLAENVFDGFAIQITKVGTPAALNLTARFQYQHLVNPGSS